MTSSDDSKLLPDKARDHVGEQFRMPGLVFLGLITILAFLLLSLVPYETRWFRRVPLYLQPGFQAYVVLSALAFFSAIAFVMELRRFRLHKNHQMAFLGLELLDWLRSCEYALWFVSYAVAIPVLGYLPSTLAFMLLLGARVGIRSRQKLAILTLIGVVTVLFFRGLLSVKMPVGQFYEFLPESIRDIAIMAL